MRTANLFAYILLCACGAFAQNKPAEYDGVLKTLGKQEVTAVHNHFFYESPRIFYMHVHGHGKAAELARMAKPAVDLIGHGSVQHQGSVTGGSGSVSAGQIDTAKLAQIIGRDGEQNGAVYKITIGRDDLVLKEMGATMRHSSAAMRMRKSRET